MSWTIGPWAGNWDPAVQTAKHKEHMALERTTSCGWVGASREEVKAQSQFESSTEFAAV